MVRPALLITLLAATPALADNGRYFAPAADGTIAFNMPSGNVGCVFIPAGGTPVYHTATGAEELHCTRVEPAYRVVVMDGYQGGHEAFAPGEVPGLPMAPVLPYGSFWQAGGFTCVSATSGLTCINASGAGLRMARAGVVTW